MNTELILDGAYKIPKAKIYAAEMDAEVRRAVALLEGGGKLVLEREGDTLSRGGGRSGMFLYKRGQG